MNTQGPMREKTSHIRRNLRQRLVLVMVVFMVGYAAVVIRIASVALAHHKLDLQEGSAAEETSPYRRASIIDRNGTLLAVNLTTASLYADPKALLDPQEAVDKLKEVFPEIDPVKLKANLLSEKRFVWIKRNLTPSEQHDVNALGIPGLYFQRGESRVYPHGNLLSHVLGFTGIDGRGLSGIEKEFDDQLRGKGQEITEEFIQPLKLSIDVRVQDVMHQALLDSMHKFKAIGAGGIILDVQTGEVVAMVSLPDFDPHNPAEATDMQRFNRMTLGVYEMGSTFKAFNMAVGFDNGKITMNSAYDVSHPIQISRFFIKDFHPVNGFMTVPEIFIHSSNIGSVHIALDVGQEPQRAFLNRLGLLRKLDIELPEKTMPLYPDKWSKISSMTISYGHGIAVTPMHVVQALAAVVNGGKLYPATLRSDRNMSGFEADQVMKKETSDNLRKLMRFVVAHGTGSKANVDGYLVGGKTGTADKPIRGNYGDKTAVISSFIGSFPMHQPKYVIFVMVDEPKRSKEFPFVTGGVVAAPIVGQVVEQIAPILGISPVDSSNEEIKREFWYKNEPDKADIASQ
jgi:cell division protein FtsI (penicillin-binding protein 3)